MDRVREVPAEAQAAKAVIVEEAQGAFLANREVAQHERGSLGLEDVRRPL